MKRSPDSHKTFCVLVYTNGMDKIYELCPSLKTTFRYTDRIDAIVKMCIAHVLNGGEYVGLYDTAIEYLEGLQ